MPGGFTKSFAERLDKLCRISVKEAVDGERVLPGHVYIAPGDWHMKLARSGANYVIRLDAAPPVNRTVRRWMCCFIPPRKAQVAMPSV